MRHSIAPMEGQRSQQAAFTQKATGGMPADEDNRDCLRRVLSVLNIERFLAGRVP